MAEQKSIKNQFSDADDEDELEPIFKYDPNTVYLPFEDIDDDPFNRSTSIY